MSLAADQSLYTDDEARLMGLAFTAAWNRLVESGSVYAQPYQAERTRELIALKVIELLRKGPPEVTRLCDDTLKELQLLPAQASTIAERPNGTSVGSTLQRCG